MSEGVKTSSYAIASLVCGIFSLCCLSPLTGVPAIILGILALSPIKKGVYTGKGIAISGIITGIIGIILSILMLKIVSYIGTNF